MQIEVEGEGTPTSPSPPQSTRQSSTVHCGGEGRGEGPDQTASLFPSQRKRSRNSGEAPINMKPTAHQPPPLPHNRPAIPARSNVGERAGVRGSPEHHTIPTSRAEWSHPPSRGDAPTKDSTTALHNIYHLHQNIPQPICRQRTPNPRQASRATELQLINDCAATRAMQRRSRTQVDTTRAPRHCEPYPS